MEHYILKTGYLIDEALEHVLAALMPANRLVCKVMLHTGLRVGDVVSLPKSKVKQNFTICEQKTGKSRRCGLPQALRAEILEQAGESAWAFPSPRDPTRHRSREAVWKDIKRAQRAFRLPVNIGTHSMRKIYAVNLMKKFGDVERVRRALNHDNDAVTMLYACADMIAAPAQRRKKT